MLGVTPPPSVEGLTSGWRSLEAGVCGDTGAALLGVSPPPAVEGLTSGWRSLVASGFARSLAVSGRERNECGSTIGR